MVLGQGSDHQRRRPVSPDGDSETQACPVAPGEASPQIHPTAGPWGSGALSLANSARAQPGRGGFRSCPTSVRFCLWLPGGSRELPCEPWPSTLALLGWRNQSLWGESRLHRRPPVPCTGRRETLGGDLRDGSRGGQQTGRVSQCLVAFAQPACTTQPARRRSVWPSGPRLLAPCIPFTAPGSAAGQRTGTPRRLFYRLRAVPGGPRGTPARFHLYTSV